MKKTVASLFIFLGIQSAAFASGFESLHYEVSITPNIKKRTLAGQTTIRIKATEAGVSELHFPISQLSIEHVEVRGMSSTFSFKSGDLLVKLKNPLKKNSEVEISVAYKSGPAPGLNFGDNYVYSAFFTCHWMICLEDPYPKASILMKITVPKNYRAVASGNLVREADAANGTRELTWEQTRPYSTYLFGFAVGEFSEAEVKAGATSLRFLGVKDSADSLKAKFAPTGDMLSFFEVKSGVPYPHSQYTQLVVPGSEAQENTSFTVVGKDELDPIVNDPKEDWVIAHELAHQWWGNLLTCKTWQHFWLNEGITVFMVAAWKEHRWGKDAYIKEIQLIRKRYQRAIDAHFDVPLAYSKEYPSLQMKRAITYSKAAIFLDTLRTSVGDTAFWRGMKDYTRSHVGGSVVSKDFQSSLERASGKDLSGLFQKWVYEN